MIIPIRCWSCGKPIAHLWEPFQQKKAKKEVLDELGATRYCCRAILLGHIDLVEVVGKYKKF